jgi:hypothetical protein
MHVRLVRRRCERGTEHFVVTVKLSIAFSFVMLHVRSSNHSSQWHDTFSFCRSRWGNLRMNAAILIEMLNQSLDSEEQIEVDRVSVRRELCFCFKAIYHSSSPTKADPP